MKTLLNGESPLPPSRLKRDLQTLLEEKLKRPLPVVSNPSMEALCVTAYRRGAGEGEKVVAHFVNYKCQVPLNAKEAWNLAPQPARNIRVRLPLSRVTGARLIDPDGAPPQPLVYAQKGDVVEFTVPEVRIYKIVEISIGPASGALPSPAPSRK